MAEIPVLDFSAYNVFKGGEFDESNVEIQKLSQEILDAFTMVGFVYIRNYGIPQAEISRLFQVAETFFKLSFEEKERVRRQCNTTNYHGWVDVGREFVDPSKSLDCKEAYDITEPHNSNLPWPDGECADFQQTIDKFFETCEKLTHGVLDLLCHGLKLNDKKLFRKTHEKMGTPDNKTTLRLLYYPVNEKLKEGHLRLGEHTDYGTITLLFQDHIGGLEVLSKKGVFIPAHPIEGTIVVNIGDLLQRWTNDKLVSTRHRVVVPRSELFESKPRQSVVFFVRPDNDVTIECLDGSNHYPPITALEYTRQRFSATYDLKSA